MICLMDDIEYAGRASSQKMTSNEQDNKAAKTQYRQDTMATALRRTANKESQPVELTRERLPE
jgi:hypothetical protein